MGGWSVGIFGCFNNCCLCVITYFAPCYIVGKNAAAIGDSCILNCLLTLVPIVNVYIVCSQRGKIREMQDIRGGPLRDLVYSIFCPFCAINQQAVECRTMKAEGMAMDMERY